MGSIAQGGVVYLIHNTISGRAYVGMTTRNPIKTYSPETYASMIESRRRPHTEEHKRKISEAGKGRKPTAAQIEARRNHRHTEEHKQYMRERMTGRVFSEETRQKMREAAIRRRKEAQK